MVPYVGLQFVIVAFPGHTDLPFFFLLFTIITLSYLVQPNGLDQKTVILSHFQPGNDIFHDPEL